METQAKEIKEAGSLCSLTMASSQLRQGTSRPLFSPHITLHKIHSPKLSNSLTQNPLRKNLQVLSEPRLGRNPEALAFLLKEGDESCERFQREAEQRKLTLASQPAWRNAPVYSNVAKSTRRFKLLPTLRFGVFCLATILMSEIVFCGTLNAETVSLTSYNVERLVSAIYLAEGGARAKKPFGILSVPCSDYSSCKKICTNTVRNNLKRWENAGKPGDYLEFLSKKYAPIGMGKNSNDPRNLNKNWYSNVKKIYGRMK
jgi:hypothetical protein